MGYYVKLNPRASSHFVWRVKRAALSFVCLSRMICRNISKMSGDFFFLACPSRFHIHKEEDPGDEVRITFVDLLLVEIFK